MGAMQQGKENHGGILLCAAAYLHSVRVVEDFWRAKRNGGSDTQSRHGYVHLGVKNCLSSSGFFLFLPLGRLSTDMKLFPFIRKCAWSCQARFCFLPNSLHSHNHNRHNEPQEFVQLSQFLYLCFLHFKKISPQRIKLTKHRIALFIIQMPFWSSAKRINK